MQWFCLHLLRIVCIQDSECWSQNALNGWVDKNGWNPLWDFWLGRQKWMKSEGNLVKNGGIFGLIESESKNCRKQIETGKQNHLTFLPIETWWSIYLALIEEENSQRTLSIY